MKRVVTASVPLQAIIESAHQLGASDVHLSPNHLPVFRISGVLHPAQQFPILSANDIGQLIGYLEETTSNQAAYTRTLSQQYDWSLNDFDLPVRVRLTVYQTTKGLSLAFRLLTKDPPRPEDIAMPAFLQQITPTLSGLVLVTGPTGSGKSTTLASWIDYCNRQFASHIITIEDPIEYVFAHGKGLVHQCELGTHFTDYNAALTDILRRDPDVLMLGELRDLASIELALRAAETGHLVLGTLHSANVVDAVCRMIDIFPAQSRSFVRHMLVNVLLGVVSQRLVPSTHPSAKQGRVANYEVLTTTTAVKHLIADQKEVQLQAAMQTGSAHKMFTFEQHYQELVQNGRVSQRQRHGF